MNLFKSLNENGTTIVTITHEASVAAQARRIVRIQDGLAIEEGDAR
jgi:putative ABC transport system ATP-binding protein